MQRYLSIFLLMGLMMTSTVYAVNITAANSAGETITVRPLDDPSNPYRGEYSGLDRWIMDNYDPSLSQENRLEMSQQLVFPEVMFEVEVTTDGWQVPDARRLELFWLRSSATQLFVPPPIHDGNGYLFFSRGKISDELWQQYQSTSEKARFQNYPRVPSWLNQMAADLLTQEAVFLPNGNILVGLIEPMARRTTAAGFEVPQDSQGNYMEGYYVEYYLYNEDGVRLPSRDRKSSFWLDAIWDTVAIQERDPHYRIPSVMPNGLPESNLYSIRGYTTLVDPDAQAILSVYDWDGTKLYDVDHPYDGVLVPNPSGVVELPSRNSNYCRTFNRETILRAYNAQSK